jgi:uncharacterized iron-regulated protein
MKTRLCSSSILLAVLAAGCASAPPAPATPVASPMPGPPPPVAVPEEGVDYVVYRADGSAASLMDVLSGLDDVDVVLMGEEHDDVVGHRVQLEVFRRVLATVGGRGPMSETGASGGVHGGQPTGAAPGRDGPGPEASGEMRAVYLSLEMFERDVQVVLDEYLADLITEDHFLASARPWDNYARDYRPMVELAKHVDVPVIAANAPRRYVNRASRLGRTSLAGLSDRAKSWLPPLPYPEASEPYRAEWDALMGDAAMHMSGDPLDGQTLWDAAMGESIARTIDGAEGSSPLVVHLAGGFHVENGTGISETVQFYRTGTSVRTVAVRAVDDPRTFDPDLRDAGDFVILTREPGA